MRKTNKLLSILLSLVMLIGLLPTTAFAANEYVDFLTTDLNVEFAETGESGFMRVHLYGNGKAMKLPLVYRTDSLDLAFDGWYTAKEGGEKVTEDTVFNGYTILYDRWSEANIDNAKIITAIEIPNSALVNGYTENEYINASSAVSMVGIVDSKVYAVYNGLNAYGSQVTGDETIDTSNDYSVVTTIRLKDGYYFAPNISLTAQNGVRAGVTYRGDGVTTNTWNSLATTVDICINFPAGGNNNVGFTTEPQSGVVEAGQSYNFTWAVSGAPTAAELQVKSGNDWAKVDDLTVSNANGTIAAQTGTKTYRILVTYANGSIYSNEFTVTWFDGNANSFSMSPVSGTVKNGTDYYYTWACVQTPATANLEIKNGDSWNDLGTATDRKITYIDNYANTTQTFRIKATMAGGSAFYSEEFTVTYKSTPLFSVQPGNGKVAVGSTYTVNYTVQTSAGDGEFDGNSSVLQKKNGGNWDNVSTPVYATETVVPAQNAATTETYRVGIKIGSNELLYSEEFTVQWIDDYTFELDQNSLAWGSIAKSDYYGEYAKMIKIMHTGTKTDTLKYDPPTNFDVQYWSGASYDTLTFTPKSSLAAGSYNESIDVWVTSNGSDVLEKKTVNLSITIEAPTFIISFDANGGTGSMVSVPNTTGTYELPACAFTAPDGKEFKAWQVNGGVEKNPGESITVTGNTVLTALWKDLPVISGYTITFAAGEGTGSMAPVAGASGNYHLPSCTFTAPANKQFKAWQVNGQGEYQPGAPITVTTDTTVTALWKDIPVNNYTVYFSSANVCGVSGSYNATQYVEQGQAMTDIIVTANDGYYFPTNFNVSEQNGVTVTRIDYMQVKISGTPTGNVTLGFGPNTKTKESTPNNLYFEATGADTGNLCNLENGVTYAVSGAATAEFTATGSTYALTNVTEGTLNVVKKASDPNTKLDSDAYGYTVSKNNSVPNLYSTNCTDANNNNGQIWNVPAEMEYQKEGDNNWTTGTGVNVIGLTPGTYYVRYKASSINLAGNAQTINIAAYNAPALTGTVTITGTAKYDEQLTATVTGTNNTGTLSYQWKRNESTISGANSETYTLVAADIGNTIKVVVTSSVESGSITSNATATVEKADGPVAPTGLAGVSPTANGGSDGKIIHTASTMEYSTDSSFTNPTGTVCPGTEITGLSAGTYYVRYKETATHKAGACATVIVPPAANVPAALTGTVTITGDAKYGSTLMATVENSNNTGELHYQWVRDASNIITGANEQTYTILLENNINSTLKCIVTSSVQTGSIVSAPTALVTKGDNLEVPTGLAGVAPTTLGGYDCYITGTTTAMEWSKYSDFHSTEGACSDGQTQVYHPGTYYVRYRQTSTYNAGINYATVVVPDFGGAITYTVSFDANGGTGTMADVTNVSGDYILPANGFTPPANKQFKAWSIGGDEKAVGATITVNANTTVTAVWEDIPVTTYTVTFNANGGSVTPANATTEATGKLATLPTPTRSGSYTFKGWYTASSGGTQVTVDKVYTENTTIYAQWNYTGSTGGGGGVSKYTIKFETNGGTTVANKSVTRNAKLAEPTAPTKDGFKFDGWYTDKELKTAYDFDTKVTKSFTLYAKWTEIEKEPENEPDNTDKHNCPSEVFDDLDVNAWYHEDIDYALKNGIFKGVTEKEFAPNDKLTRAMLVTVLYRVEGEPATNRSIPFADIDMGAYYANAVVWAQQNGIVKGVSETEFAPNDNITR